MNYSATSRLNPSQHTPPKFILQQTVKVPKELHPSPKARVVGQEWSPDNNKTKKVSATWLYCLKLEDGSWVREITEEELSAWNGV